VARLAFDLLVMAALCKELLELARQGVLSLETFAIPLLALSFFLGVAPGEAGLVGVLRDPIRSLIRTGVAMVSVVIYWQLLWLRGVWWQFGVLYAVAIWVYLLGRWAGLAWRAIWLVSVILLAAYLFLQLSGTR
jgi:hypothetical protein